MNMILFQLFMCIWGSESYIWSSFVPFFTLSFIVLRIFLQNAFPFLFIFSNGFRFRWNQRWMPTWISNGHKHTNLGLHFLFTFASHNINLKWVPSMKTDTNSTKKVKHENDNGKDLIFILHLHRWYTVLCILGIYRLPIHVRFIS